MEKRLIERIYWEDSRRLLNMTEFDIVSVGSEGYGETGYLSMERIINYFHDYFNEKTVFYDLGCGTGKIVYHVGLAYPVKKSCGIEFSKERCATAMRISEKYSIKSEKISIINKNILDCDISDATVIYIDNTLFPKLINEKIYDIIPDGCLVISRARINNSKILDFNFKKENQLDISHKIGGTLTNYGGSSLYSMIRNR
jgi:SAM-dependent methyltransferase